MEDYIYVRQREDGMYGVSLRFVGEPYQDEYPELSPLDTTPAPPDRIGVYATPHEAVLAGHAAEATEGETTYGVCLGDAAVLAAL